MQAINAYAPDIIECPYAAEQRLRQQAPVYHDEVNNIYLVSSFALVDQVLSHPGLFSSRFVSKLEGHAEVPRQVADILAQGLPRCDTLLVADAPRHTRSRALVGKAFNSKRLKHLEPMIEQLTEALVDEALAKGEIEFRSEFAEIIPLRVTAAQFQVPAADIDKNKYWSDVIRTQLGHAQRTLDEMIEHAHAIIDFQNYYIDKITHYRGEPGAGDGPGEGPGEGDDMIAVLAAACRDEDEPLSMAEAIEIVRQTFIAGHETTTSAMTSGIYRLIKNPQQLQQLQADLRLIPGFIEETLRLDSPTANMWRVTTQDVTLGDVDIPKDSMVLIRMGSANRDDQQFPAADQLHIARANARTHLGFGKGVHTCIGRFYARSEMKIAFEQLLSRADTLRLLDEKNDYRHLYSVLLRGFEKLYIGLEARGRQGLQ